MSVIDAELPNCSNQLVKTLISICNSTGVRILMLPFMPKLTGPILCCFKFNQDIIYLGYDVSRVRSSALESALACQTDLYKHCKYFQCPKQKSTANICNQIILMTIKSRTIAYLS